MPSESPGSPLGGTLGSTLLHRDRGEADLEGSKPAEEPHWRGPKAL